MYESLVPSAEMRGAYAVMWKLIRVCESYVLRNDVDAHPLPSELERVCESCLVPSLPISHALTGREYLLHTNT